QNRDAVRRPRDPHPLAPRSAQTRARSGANPTGALDPQKWRPTGGVAGAARAAAPAENPGRELYMPFQQHPFHANELQLVVRTAGEPDALAAPLVRHMRALNPEIAIQTTTLHAMIYDAVAAPRFRAFLGSVFAGVALLLA